MTPTPPPRLLELESERAFAIRSLEDLEREHDAGDVDSEDYLALRSRYVERAADALRAIEAEQAKLAGAANEPAVAGLGGWKRLRRGLGRRRTRRALGVVAAISVVSALGLVAAALAGVRLPGEDPTGSINVPLATEVAEQLAQATYSADHGGLAIALATYDAVLKEVPNQPAALTYKGWLVRLSGKQAGDAAVVNLGDASIAKAVSVAPGYPDGRALDAIALLEDRSDLRGSMAEIRAFLADHPSASLLDGVGPQIADDLVQAGAPVPGALRVFETPTT